MPNLRILGLGGGFGSLPWLRAGAQMPTLTTLELSLAGVEKLQKLKTIATFGVRLDRLKSLPPSLHALRFSPR
jgi:hypothetical protein